MLFIIINRSVPDNYKILFAHGGGTAQFAAMPMNLCSEVNSPVDYVVAGAWSQKACKEAEKYCKVHRVLPKVEKYTRIPGHDEWDISADAKYIFYCENETIHGIEFNKTPTVPNQIPLVSDMTSNFLTKPLDVSKYGCIIAGSQKNFGIAGFAVIIVRDDLIGKAMSICPSVLDYKVLSDNRSLYNTPSCYPLVLIINLKNIFFFLIELF